MNASHANQTIRIDNWGAGRVMGDDDSCVAILLDGMRLK